MINGKEKNFISAVVYVHNHEKQVEAFLPMLYRELSDHFDQFEIICVDDVSTDGSIPAVKAFASKIDSCIVSIVHMSLFQGLELSMNAGVDLAIGDYVFEFDSTLADYDRSLIMRIYKEAQSGFDIVSAAPKGIKRKSSWLFYKIYNKNSKSIYPLRSEAFRILSRRAVNRVHSISKTVPYRKALYANCGLRLNAVFYEPEMSEAMPFSRQTDEQRRDLAADTFILFTDVAYKISLALSGILLMFTAFSAVYTCVTFFGQHRPVAGWTTTMLLLSGGFFGVFLLLTIVIKYLSMLVDLIFKRQKYLIESIEKLTK